VCVDDIPEFDELMDKALRSSIFLTIKLIKEV